MQLDRFFTGHFASHFSPTRERREAFFAATPTPPSNGTTGQQPGTPDEEKRQTPEATTGAHPESRTWQNIANIVEQSARSRNVLGGIELVEPQALYDIYNGKDIAEHLIFLNRITERELRNLARSLTIDVDKREQQDLSVFERIRLNANREQRKAVDTQMRTWAHERLKENPEVMLRSAWEIQERIRRYERLQPALDDFFDTDKKVLEFQNDILQLQDDNLQELPREERPAAAQELDFVEHPMVKALDEKLQAYLNQQAVKKNSKLEKVFIQHFKNLESERRRQLRKPKGRIPGETTPDWKLSDEEKDSIRKNALQEISFNAQKKLRAKKNIGGTDLPRDSENIADRDEYLARLKKQELGMKTILDVQLRERSVNVLQLHLSRFEELLAPLKLPNVQTLADAQRVIQTRTPRGTPGFTLAIEQQEQQVAEDLERRFFETHGISIVSLLTDFDQLRVQVQRQNREARPQDLPAGEPYRLPPNPTEKNFLDVAKQDLEKWNKSEAELGDDLERLRQDQQDTERWAFAMADEIRKIEGLQPGGQAWKDGLEMMRVITGTPESQKEIFAQRFNEYLDVLRGYRGKDTRQKRKEMRGQLSACVTPVTFPPDIQNKISTFIGLMRRPEMLQRTVEESKTREERLEAEKAQSPVDQLIENVCKKTRGRLQSIIGILAPELPKKESVFPDPENRKNETRRDLYTPLRHAITEHLKLSGVFAGLREQLDQQMNEALQENQKDPADRNSDAALRLAYEAEAEVDKLHLCKQFVDEIAPNVVLDTSLPKNVFASYNRTTCRISINKQLRGNPEFDAAYQHERGHAILHILTERTGLFPNLIGSTFDTHKNLKDEQGETFESLLDGLKDTGSYRNLEKQNLQGTARTDAFTEELLVRYADWLRIQKLIEMGKTPDNPVEFHRSELKLFDMLESGPAPRAKKVDAKALAELQKIGVFKQREETAHLEGDEAAQQDKGAFNMKESLSESDRALRNIKQFINAYENETEFPAEALKELKIQHGQAEDERARLAEKFKTRASWSLGPDGQPVAPEKNPLDQAACKNLEEYTTKLESFTEKHDIRKLDTTKEERHPGIWENMWRGVRLASINDVIKFCKDTWEDVQTMYKRRQDGLLKDVGYAITKPLQDSNLTKIIPGLNNYLPGLHAYHQRRYSGTETEAADKWKDGMKNEDSHTLLHFMHYTKNKDAIRGIISLLCDRGEMDWNDTGVWATLRSLSGYDMPEGPCLRSDVLRDTWLRKIISYIWNDKELYYHWRSENDSKIKSGKEHFTPWVDQLSNLKGGMEAELQKQLRLYTEWSEHEQGTPPEDIKPHLYEKVIHYAIENGKMTMEQKFFYLIRGVASGLLSIDRLRTLAGEEGGVLNQFPFIDYFYHKNNTLPEVQILARRLTETDGGVDTFKPGAKTTMWIQLELVREPSVQQRLSKGTSGTRSEAIDHEDVPLFLPQLDYNAVRGMADIISGSRQKMSPEALKNLYCGYSSKFKIFGRLAELEDKEQVERFTGEDASIMADAIGAYVDIDNLLARRAYDRDTRPTLSLSQLDSKGPSSDGHTVAQYRENMNKFVIELVKRLVDDQGRSLIEQSDHWKAYLKQNKLKDGGKKTRPKPGGQPGEFEEYYEKEEPIRLLDNYISTDRDVIRGKKSDKQSAEVARKLFDGTPAFVQALKEVLPKNMRILKEVLKKFTIDYTLPDGQTPHPDYENGFFDEGGSAGKITLDNARAAVLAREDARKYRAMRQGHHT